MTPTLPVTREVPSDDHVPMTRRPTDATVLLTGFPGFLGSRLVPRILGRDPEATIACLVQPKFADLARARVDQLTAAAPATAGRVTLVEGDLTSEDLGLADGGALAAGIREIWHLAAVYDLSVARDVGMRVNRDGTRHVLRFAERCDDLRRLEYVSTCYVSGRWCGPFSETDLDVGQQFNNFYEETKFLAEVEVAGARERGLPVAVYRPSIVVGDSGTGETQKFDGPYVLLQWLLRQSRQRVALVPYIGDPTMARFNVVPSDFVLDAITHLSGRSDATGRTYQLADPRPLTVDGFLHAACEAVGVRGLRVRLPHRLTTWALRNVDPLEHWIGIPAASVEYFVHPTHYDTTSVDRDLAGSGIHCPSPTDYLPRLVDYLRSHAGEDVGVMV
jgi:thioester reductase-like protein